MFLSNNPSSGDINSSNLSCSFVERGENIASAAVLPVVVVVVKY